MRSDIVPGATFPDYELSEAAWQQGRKDLFYPYGKTFRQSIGEQD